MPADAAEVTERWPNYQEGDFVITDYVFRTGETLPELKLHYRTLGTARRNTAGKIINGVLLLQGNTGTGANWLRSSLADELFAPGEPLDAAEYFIIMPDAIGRGGSSKPSDGLKGKFPHYRYHDMVESGTPNHVVSAARLHRRFRLARGVAVLGLDKDAGDFGERCLDLALDTGDRRLDIGGAASVVEIEAERGQHLVRAEMHGQHLIGADDAWCHLGDALDFGAHFRMHR